MADEFTDILPPNFPTRRVTQRQQTLTIPRDLVANGREFYTGIQFVPYDFQSTLSSNSSRAVADISPRLCLPIPRKVNDNQAVIWEAESFASSAAQAALSTQVAQRRAGLLANIVNAFRGPIEAFAGATVNPFLWMLFKQPTFKEYTFNWTLTPSNEQETRDIAFVINHFKENMLPFLSTGSLIYGYPNIVLVKFYPDDKFMFRFKPCVVLAVASDYTAAGGPSFFKRTNAPTTINFSVILKEIDLWTREDYRQNAY